MSSSSLAAAGTPRPARTVSHFEFWPGWLFYAPIVAQWVLLGLRHGSMTLPTLANPCIETGGLCGESKSSILDQLSPAARGLVAPYAVLTTGPGADSRAAQAQQGLGWPVVLKPDIGCNGAGIRLVRDAVALGAALASFAPGVAVMLQRFIPDRGEAGIFYIRQPGEARGRVTSLTLKIAPEVTGDGQSTLEQLIRADERAGLVPHLYLDRLRDRLGTIPAAGEAVPLVFSGNHCKGSIFQDGGHLITPALAEAVDRFAHGLPSFHFGRIDVRYASEAALRAGQGFTVIEVNGAGSEATHIWDANCTLREAYATQLRHYGEAWAIGRLNRGKGHKPMKLRALYRSWMRQRRLMAGYPMND